MPKVIKETKVLSASQRASLQDEKRELEATIREIEDGTGAGTRGAQIDRKHIEASISHLQNQIDAGTPGKLSGVQKDKLAKRAEELKAEILVGMPNYDQMHKPGKYPGIVRKNVAWTRRTNRACEEYKQIMRKIEPDDPTASSIERFRPR